YVALCCDPHIPGSHTRAALFLFFFTTPTPPDIYTLSLHDALPISRETWGSSNVAVVLKLAMTGLMFRLDRRIRLHHEILRRSRHAVFIRTVVHHRCHTAEIVMRRRRGGNPFKSGRFPRIVGGRLALFH